MAMIRAFPLAVLTAILAPLAAMAQNCGPRDAVLATLSGQYGEVRQGIGLAGPSGVVEIFASAATGTWTITLTRPDGLTCLIASGDHYQAENATVPVPGNPA